MIVFPLMLLAFVGVMWLIFAPTEKPEEQSQAGLNTDLPTPEQNAIADGYAPDSPAPVVQQTSARTTTSNGHNPFRN